MKIFCDMDGVLTDFNKAAMDFYNVPNDTVFQPNSWDTVPRICEVMNMSARDFWENLTVEFWSEMPWMYDGHKILEHLMEMSSHVCLLTSPANAISAHGKILWIQKNLPMFYKERRFCLCSNKFYIAHSHALLVDDYDKNIKEFNEHGGHGYLYPRFWNSKHMDSGQESLLAISDEPFRRFISNLYIPQTKYLG